MDNDTKNKIGDLVRFIQSSSLSEEDRNLWFNAITQMPKEAIQTLWLFMKNAPQDLEEMNELMKRKRDALLKNDVEGFKKIVEEEKSSLENS